MYSYLITYNSNSVIDSIVIAIGSTRSLGKRLIATVTTVTTTSISIMVVLVIIICKDRTHQRK